MRICTFSIAGSRTWGVVDERGIVDLGTRIGGSVLDVLQEHRLAAVRDEAAVADVDYDLGAVTFEPPVDRPEKIACIGVNYANRNAEYKDGSDEPQWPSLFMRTIDSFTGHNEPLWRPPESAQLDYEGEIAIVIGKTGHRIAEHDALGHIAGLTLLNAVSISEDGFRAVRKNVNNTKTGSSALA